MKRKITSLLMIMAMVSFLFAGCKKSEVETNKEATKEPTKEATKEPTKEPTKEAEKKEDVKEVEPTKEQEAPKSTELKDVKGSDGQPLLLLGKTRDVPERPKDKEGATMWDIEYAGRQTEKEPLLPSPKDGIKGKKIIMIAQSEHPYWTAVSNGFKLACEAFGAEYEIWNPNGDLNQQNQFVDRAIASKADMVLLATLDSNAGVQQFKKLYDAKIPAIAFNMIPTDEAMKYVLGITAPDDFGQFRMLADYLAKAVDGKAGVGYITHIPGGSPYFARYSNVEKYYKENYPDMKTLDVQSPGFDAPKVKQVVADWITRFGDKLTCIVLADDSAQALGAAQACEEAGRSDIKIIAAGNSKVGMDLVKEKKLFAITYQSAEADGAIPVVLAADFFAGEDIGTNAAYYLPQAVITPENVTEYEPAQW